MENPYQIKTEKYSYMKFTKKQVDEGIESILTLKSAITVKLGDDYYVFNNENDLNDFKKNNNIE